MGKIALSCIGAPRHSGGHEVEGSYKANFMLEDTSDVQKVYIPFNHFSSDWSDYTGDCDTKDPTGYQHRCCDEKNTDVCPDAKRLKAINKISIWAEGHEGDFYLELYKIDATQQ